MNPTSEVIEQLRALQIRAGGVLLVHASLRSLGQVEGGAETVIQALLRVLGDQGTLLMPALSYETVGAHHPHFDVRHTPSCVGALPEFFRQRAGTLRSLHPTHSVCAVGQDAAALLASHHHDTTPCGSHSPFHQLPHKGGQILFLGCGLRPNTSMHAVEEMVEPPYLYSPVVQYEMIDQAGSHFPMAVRSHNFKGWTQRYDRLADVLQPQYLRRGRVLQADCFVVEAEAMWQAAYHQLQINPLYFVDRDAYESPLRSSQ
jgi:aminoglycoside 3-N-acetyltransferase